MARLSDRLRRDDAGFTLVESLVASTIFLVASAMLMLLFTTSARTSQAVRSSHDINEEGRNAINRMSRELRQATSILHVSNPDGPAFSSTGLTAISFRADFNGDGCAGNPPDCPSTDVTINPETLTYCFNPNEPDAAARTHLWLIPTGLTSTPATCDTAGAQPILAGNVASFWIEYRSNKYRYDTSPVDGVITWREIDSANPPVGDTGGSDGNINTSAIVSVNSVVLHLRMQQGDRTQDYVTQIDLRNRP